MLHALFPQHIHFLQKKLYAKSKSSYLLVQQLQSCNGFTLVGQLAALNFSD